MPGISFLFKKRFHPSRLDNQKRVFVTEENKKKHLEQERELALQVAKERELQMYEGLGKAPELDPRNASLKFMYHAPAAISKNKATENTDGTKRNGDHIEKANLLAKEAPVQLDANGDDEHVRAFRAKFLSPTTNNASSKDEENSVEVFGPPPPPLPQDDHDSDEAESIEDNSKPAALPPTHYHQSSLEQAIGRKKQAILTAEELQARHPILKNAPTQGSYAKHTAVKHKPFHVVIRNVRCLRCGEWGHCSGDRECLLRDHNPLDFDRQLREDPMAQYTNEIVANRTLSSNNINNDSSSNKNNTKVHISAAQARQFFFGGEVTNNLSHDTDHNGGYISSDPEGDFLKTLTRREKKLLLRKLHNLQNPNDSSAVSVNGSNSDSSSSSSSDSDNNSYKDSSDESSRRNRKSKKHKHRRHRHKIQKKERKRRDREDNKINVHDAAGEDYIKTNEKKPRLL